MFRTLVCTNKYLTNAVAVRFLGPAYFQRTATTTTTTAPASTDATSPDDTKLTPALIAEQCKQIQELLKEELPKPYDGPERDHVNFPRRQRAIYPGKIRMGFLPEEWFQFFYKKTGVTGPYLFGTGLITFLLSKELFVIEEEFSTGVAIFILAYTAIKKFGPATRKFAEKLVQDQEDKYEAVKNQNIKSLEDAIAEEKKAVWQAEGQKILMEAKRENVQMQLEAEYRRRLMHVYDQVKRRLDYQLELYNAQRKFEQKHMVDWIVNNVIKSITPQQEKEALQKCIEDLKVLSQAR